MKLPKNPTIQQVAEKYRELGFVPFAIKKTTVVAPTDKEKAQGKKFKKQFSPPIAKWESLSENELFETINEKSQGLCIRTGENDNGDVIWCLDFDDYKHVDHFRGLMLAEYDATPFEESSNGGLHYFFKALNKEAFTGFSKKNTFEFKIGETTFEKLKTEVFCHRHMTYVYPTTCEFEGKNYQNKLIAKLNDYEIPTNKELEEYVLSLIAEDKVVVIKEKAQLDEAEEDEDEQKAVHEHNPKYWEHLYNQLKLDKIKEAYGGEKSWKDLVLIAKYLWKNSEEGLDFICKFCEKFYGDEYNENEVAGIWARANKYKQRPGFPTLKKLVLASDGSIEDPNEITASKCAESWIYEDKVLQITKLKNLMNDLPNDRTAFALYDQIIKDFSKHVILHRRGASSYMYLLEKEEVPRLEGNSIVNFSWKEYLIEDQKNAFAKISKYITYEKEGQKRKEKHTFNLVKDWESNTTYSKYLIEVHNIVNVPGSKLVSKSTSGELNFNIWQRPTKTLDEIIKHIEEKYTEEEIEEYSKLFKNHVFEVLANNDKKDFKYITNMFLGIINKPGFQPRACMIFKGAQGAGKSIIADLLLKPYFGKGFNSLTNPDLVKLGSAEGLVGRTAIVFEEFHAKDDDNYAKLKKFIEANDYDFRFMHQGVKVLPNYATLIIFSNKAKPIQQKASDDRRFAEFMVNEKYCGNKAYFDKLLSIPQLFGAYYYAKMFKNPDIQQKFNEFNFGHPRTAENLRMFDTTTDVYLKSDLYIYNEFMNKSEELLFTKDELYDLFKSYCNHANIQQIAHKSTYMQRQRIKASDVRLRKRKLVQIQHKQKTGEDLEDDDPQLTNIENSELVHAIYIKTKKQFKQEFKHKYGRNPEDIDI